MMGGTNTTNANVSKVNKTNMLIKIEAVRFLILNLYWKKVTMGYVMYAIIHAMKKGRSTLLR